MLLVLTVMVSYPSLGIVFHVGEGRSMLVGSNEIVSSLIPEIRRSQPESILDVGCRTGAWGILCRAFLEWYEDAPFTSGNNVPAKNGPGIVIDGIENNAALSQAVPPWVYDRLSNGDEITVLSSLSRQQYDLVIALSPIEYITQDADRLINGLLRVGKKVIVAVPKHAPTPKPDDAHPNGCCSTRPDKYLMGKGFNKFVPNPQLWIAVRDPKISGVAQVKKQELAAKRARLL